jgi:hypothetical protein
MAGLAPAGVARDTLTRHLYRQSRLGGRGSRQGRREAGDRADQPPRHPRLFLNTMDQGAAIIAAIGPERLGLQFDLYHCQMTEGDIVKRVEKHLPIIAHMQVADVPGRNEPGTGEVNWPFVFERIDALGYRGWIGCEYRPKGETVAGLGFCEVRACKVLISGETQHEDRISSASASWASPWRCNLAKGRARDCSSPSASQPEGKRGGLPCWPTRPPWPPPPRSSS